MRLTKLFLTFLKLHPEPAYKLAQKEGKDSGRFYRECIGVAKVHEDDLAVILEDERDQVTGTGSCQLVNGSKSNEKQLQTLRHL